MPTYKSVQLEVRAAEGCFEISGQDMRPAWNRFDQNARKHACPPGKQQAILRAIRRLEGTGHRQTQSPLRRPNDNAH